MKRIKLVGLALIAVFALGAFASASAFAEEPTLTFENGEVPTAAKPAEFKAELARRIAGASHRVVGLATVNTSSGA